MRLLGEEKVRSAQLCFDKMKGPVRLFAISNVRNQYSITQWISLY